MSYGRMHRPANPARFFALSHVGMQKALIALEQAEAHAEQDEAENTRLQLILAAAQACVLTGDSTSMPEGDPDDCKLLHDIADLFCSKRDSEAEVARLTKMVDWLAKALVERGHFIGDISSVSIAANWKEAARRAVAKEK